MVFHQRHRHCLNCQQETMHSNPKRM